MARTVTSASRLFVTLADGETAPTAVVVCRSTEEPCLETGAEIVGRRTLFGRLQKAENPTQDTVSEGGGMQEVKEWKLHARRRCR